MITPGLTFVILALAAFRVTRLIGWDDLPPIARLRARVTGEHVHYDTTQDRDRPLFRHRRPTLAHFLGCGYCSGFWISLAFYILWRFWPVETLYAAMPFALSGAVGIVARMLDP